VATARIGIGRSFEVPGIRSFRMMVRALWCDKVGGFALIQLPGANLTIVEGTLEEFTDDLKTVLAGGIVGIREEDYEGDEPFLYFINSPPQSSTVSLHYGIVDMCFERRYLRQLVPHLDRLLAEVSSSVNR
jgi:hypothetical protein